jgi:ABC-type branched-subunit amino acid transport system ATPase component
MVCVLTQSAPLCSGKPLKRSAEKRWNGTNFKKGHRETKWRSQKALSFLFMERNLNKNLIINKNLESGRTVKFQDPRKQPHLTTLFEFPKLKTEYKEVECSSLQMQFNKS